MVLNNLGKIWRLVIGIMPAYGAYQSMQSGKGIWVGLIAGLIVAGIFYAITWMISFILRKIKGSPAPEAE